MFRSIIVTSIHLLNVLPSTNGVVGGVDVPAVVTVVTSSHAFGTTLLITISVELSNTTVTLATGLSSVTR